MKNSGRIFLLICAFSFTLLLGIFIGRNLKSDFVQLSVNEEMTTIVETRESKDFRLNINTATQVQLMELPGIGEVTAERIITYRTENGLFHSTDDLLNVEGIGEKKLMQIEALIKVGG